MRNLMQGLWNAVSTRTQEMAQAASDRINLHRSRSIPVDNCATVCLALGPYRNLTTLTAAVLFLHPHCQVLNHAGDRIFGRRAIDFLSAFTPRRLRRFMQFAIQISTTGKPGNHGGSITYSHAFDAKYPMKDLHHSSGAGLLKQEIKALFWKESLKISNLIRAKNVDLPGIFQKDEDRLRFLMPIRNPMDCAVSNLKTGHAELFEDLPKNPSVKQVTRAILDHLVWFAELQKKFPGRFFHYFQHDITGEVLGRLATFLKLDPSPSWIEAARAAMKIEGGYQHDRGLREFYENYVRENFARFPVLRAGLLKFAEGAATGAAA